MRLKSRWPFGKSLASLDSTVKPNKSISTWLRRLWLEQWSTLDPPIGLPDLQVECPKINISRLAWVKLNQLRTGIGRFKATLHSWRMERSPLCLGVGRFKATLHSWRMERSPLCLCASGEEQTASHIISGQCLSNLFHGTAEDLAQVTPSVCSWLETISLDI